jgi:IS5 family transposase
VRTGDKRLLATAFAKGKTHDFALFKQSRLPLAPQQCCLADSGYQGLAKQHANACTPHKRSKHHPLTVEQKEENRALSQQRVVVEHVINWLKRFAILRGPYRNHLKRFGLRFNLIAALYNAHLDL